VSTAATRSTDPEIEPLWRAIAARLEQGTPIASVQKVRAALSPNGRARLQIAINARRGRRQPRILLPNSDGTTTVEVKDVTSALSWDCAELEAFVEATVGISGQARARKQALQARAEVWVHAKRVLPANPDLVRRLRGGGILRDDVAATYRLINALAHARCLLPLPRPVHIAILSMVCAGDPHYFDLNADGHGDRLVHLATEMLHAPAPLNPAHGRAHLLRVGVTAERITHSIAVFNVSAVGDGPTDRALRLAYEDRRPQHLTLLDLTEAPPQFDTARPWHIVENPSVLEEARSRGSRAAFATTCGTFTAVDHELLALAQAQGVELRYSGDLDASGHLIARVAAGYGASVHLMECVDVAPEESNLGRDGTATGQAAAPIYQEDPRLLDLLLGADPCHPLRNR